jgi:hypothetical protein
MINVSPNTSDLYLNPSPSNSCFHDELAKEGVSREDFSKAKEEFENLIGSFLTAAEDAGFSYFSNCGQIYFEKGNKFQFMLTDYI